MITGYNTDVEYDSVTYHVQTEDTGLQTPVIVTLVYAGGAILASKRTPYDDLISVGFDEEALTKRLQRQHKLICAAVHAGRIEDLKRMSDRETSASDQPKSPSQGTAVESSNAAASATDANLQSEMVLLASREEPGLSIGLVGEQELRGGDAVTLRLLVSRAGDPIRERVPAAQVTVKTLGTSFAPQSLATATDERGIASLIIELPDFKSGRAAILIRAEANGEAAELRRIILPANS